MKNHKRWTVVLLGLLLAVPSLAAEFKSAKEAIEKGTALLDKGNYDKAIAAFSEAIRLDPKDARAYYNRARAFGLKGDPNKAITDSDEAIRLDPKFANAFYNRACAELEKGDLDGCPSFRSRKCDGIQQPWISSCGERRT